MANAQLDGNAITDWTAFHRESQRAFGFPDFYGRNLSAWVDSLSYLRDEDDGMTSFVLGPDEVLRIEVVNSDSLRQQAPEILDALQECTSDVNQRYLESGEKPALALVLL
jgi:RNAse (barnase) inhibitor barstar